MAPRRLGPVEQREWRLLRTRPAYGQGQRRLARRLGVSEPTAAQALHRLASWNRLRMVARPRPTGGRQPDLVLVSGFGFGLPSCKGCSTNNPRVVAAAGKSRPAATRVAEVQPNLFVRRGARAPRPPTPATQLLTDWSRIYAEERGTPWPCPSATARQIEMAHAKRLLTLVPDPDERRAFLQGYARVDDGVVVAAGHPLRLALIAFRFPRLLAAARAVVGEAIRARLEAEEQARIAADVVRRWESRRHVH